MTTNDSLAGMRFLQQKLDIRRIEGLFRELVPASAGLIDFCSTDYLGFARSRQFHEMILAETEIQKGYLQNISGSTGSRLMRGHHPLTDITEKKIADHHKAESALIFNSGYDSNVGIFSCVPQRGDVVLYDELIHVSARDGMRLGFANHYSFRHNDLSHLEDRLNKFKAKRLFVAVESVYSMEGDLAPLKELVELCNQYNAHIIVDEAHATGVYGKRGEGRVTLLGLEKRVFAVLHTFGKALGCHGAAVVGSTVLKQYLINYAHPFIYSTAIPPLNIIAISCAYNLLNKSDSDIKKLHKLTSHFISSSRNLAKRSHEQTCCRMFASKSDKLHLLPATSPIQGIIIQGNENAKLTARKMQEQGFDVRAILNPTVAKGKERLRICLHAFNTEEEIDRLLECVQKTL